MEPDVALRQAHPDDAECAADFAEVKRAEYARYSPIFWRPAEGAREKHLPFLRHCMANDDYAASVAERGGEEVGVILANRRGAPPPFHADPEPTWFVDDFFVAQPDLWPTMGAALLARIADEAQAHGAARVIVVTAQRDEPKRSFLRSMGYTLAATWWVHPLTPTDQPIPAPTDIQAIIAPAPSVYDPGGLVALARSLGAQPATRVEQFDAWAAASQAVLAVIAARAGDAELAEVLAAQGYTAASEWYVRTV